MKLIEHKKYISYILKKIIKTTNQRRPFVTDRAAPEDILNIPCCFVLSTGRCGTALLTEILKESDKVMVEHNPKPTLEYVSSLIHERDPDAQELELAILSARFDNYFEKAFNNDRFYIETNNRITFFAQAIAGILPNSKFIHLVRNPADFVRSGMRRGYYAKGVQQHQRLTGGNKKNWNNLSRMEKIAWEWNEINSRIEAFKNRCDANRVITIKSEELWYNQGVTDKIFSFLEVDNPYSKNERKIKNILNNPVNKQMKGEYPKFDNWSENDKQLFFKMVPLSTKYGYFN